MLAARQPVGHNGRMVYRAVLSVCLLVIIWPAVGQEPHKLTASHLPNAYQIHPHVISGGLPDGEDAFRELAALGVKTIISVDGAKPDVPLAEKYGLRYVHLPHGYGGVPDDRVKELAKAV